MKTFLKKKNVFILFSSHIAIKYGLALVFVLDFVLISPVFSDMKIYNWHKLDAVQGAPSAREFHRMVSYDGKVFLYGGGEPGRNQKKSENYLDDIWEFDFKERLWRECKTIIQPPRRRLHGMTEDGNNHIIIFAGENKDGLGDKDNILSDTWEYDVTSHRWKEVSGSKLSPRGRSGHAMVHLGNGNILMFGGFYIDENGTIVVLSDTWIFDSRLKQWNMIKTVHSPPARAYHAMASISQNRVILFGGNDSSDTWVYDGKKNDWQEIKTVDSPSSRRYHAMVSGGNDVVFLLGGFPGRFPNYNDFWKYDDHLKNWVRIESKLPGPRHGHFMAELGYGKVLLFGGYSETEPLGDTWELDFK